MVLKKVEIKINAQIHLYTKKHPKIVKNSPMKLQVPGKLILPQKKKVNSGIKLIKPL